MASRKDRLVRTGFAAIIGFLLGLMAAPGSGRLLRRTGSAVYYPLPHHVPKSPGGVSLRFAMAHDVLHERYPKHGPAHYRERNRLTRDKLAKLAPDDPAAFPLTDDLAAGLARLGQLDEAVGLLQEKLAVQRAKGLTGRDLYTTYANLGAILFHARLGNAADPAARKQAEAGVALIKKAVEVNPEAHFGREEWQVAYAEFLLAAIVKPEVLRECDFIGNRLAATPDEFVWKHHYFDTSYGRAYDWEFSRGRSFGLMAVSHLRDRADDLAVWETVKGLRDSITKVGGEQTRPVDSTLGKRSPFDEPCLGVIGMWRQGIGADPHFALCLGETMLRVGQRFVAWAAFERASRMADRFGPTPETRQFLRSHCRKRQGEIEATLTPAEAVDLRPKFDAELAHGERHQREYQEYEARKIAAGASIADDHFFDEFHAGREPIASPSGPEEWYATLGDENRLTMDRAGRGAAAVGWGLLGAGVTAAGTAWLLRRQRILASAGS